MNGEEKRAVLLLEGAGSIGSSLEGDVAAGDTDHSKYDARGECMYFGSKLKLFQVFQVGSGTSENENFKMR
jgi:hypothetical protein